MSEIGVGVGIGFQMGKGGAAASPASNLLRWTEEFDDVVWVKSGVSVTADDTAAPDSSVTADKLSLDQDGVILQLSETAATAGSTLAAFFVTDSWSRYEATTTFDGNPYVFSIYLKALVGESMNVTAILGVSSGMIRVILSDNDSLGPFSIYSWGAQLETGAVATEYVHRTT